MSITGRLAIQQRVLPSYRADFFDLLAEKCPQGLALFAGQPLPAEALGEERAPARVTLTRGKNRYRPPRRLFLYSQAGLLQWLERSDPSALVTETNPRNLSLGAALRWMHARHRPVIGWGLGAPKAPGLRGWLRSLGRGGFIHRFDALITYSLAGAEEFRRLGFPAERIFVAPNAVTRAPTQAPPIRKDQFIGKPVVLFVGRLQARKKVDTLIHSCAALPPALQPELVVVGEGPERAHLEGLAAACYPQTLFTGDLRGDALHEQLRRADVFVLPGTGGLAIQEAMSFALPVIVGTADGTQSDLVREGNGWLLPGEGVHALAECLARALGDVPRLRRMGLESYRIVREEINLEKMVAAFENAITAVTNR